MPAIYNHIKKRIKLNYSKIKEEKNVQIISNLFIA